MTSTLCVLACDPEGGANASTEAEVSRTPRSHCAPKLWEGSFDTDDHAITELADITMIEGSLSIHDTDLVDLDELACLEHVCGRLEVSRNADLVQIDALDHLRGYSRVGPHDLVPTLPGTPTACGNTSLVVRENPSLDHLPEFAGYTSKVGFESGDEADIIIDDNDALASIDAFQNLSSPVFVQVTNNDALTSLSGFSSTEYLDLTLDALPNLNVLSVGESARASTLHVTAVPTLEAVQPQTEVEYAEWVQNGGPAPGLGEVFPNAWLTSLEAENSTAERWTIPPASLHARVTLVGNPALHAVDLPAEPAARLSTGSIADNPELDECFLDHFAWLPASGDFSGNQECMGRCLEGVCQ